MDHRDDLLDRLVPAPWSPRRRALAATLAALLLAVAGLGWWAGLLGPNVRPWTGWTSAPDLDRGHVEVRLDVHNRGLLPLHDVTLELPDEAVAVSADPVTDRLGPGETVTAAFTVAFEHCEDRTRSRSADLRVRARSGVVTASRSLAPGSATGPPLAPNRGGLATVLEPACDALE